ncbi:DUF2723 domain-containing protein [Pontiellaceae bacterium B1224]|nr:DUF2723 domain-containing protein [Pontiellaceae bacterium B1224]
MKKEKFFRKSEWFACWATFIISLIVYTITLQPTLGLEDSGELIVASDFLGVPHPPGYPIWSLLTWFFQWIFHSVTFHGQPNPAWAVNWFSAVSGAAACGALALLISRSGMDLLRSFTKELKVLGESTESLFCAVAGISGGLLLAFGQGMWSQAVIAEVYTLNIFFQSLVLVFLYRWISESNNTKWLMLSAFTFGLGITNHQTLMFMGLAMAAAVLFNDLDIFSRKNVWGIIGVVIFLPLSILGIYFGILVLQVVGVLGCVISCLLIRQPFLVRDFLITGSFYILLVGFNKWAAGNPEMAQYMWVSGPDYPGFWIWTIYALAVPTIATFVLPRGRVVGPTFLIMFIGLGFYFYMAFSSDQNPPINWGYPRTWQGFMHAITRGQYERVKLAHVFTPRFLEQVETYLTDLRSQFYGPIAVLGLIPLALFPIMRQLPQFRWRLAGRIGRFEFFSWKVTWNLTLSLILIKLLDTDAPIIQSCLAVTAIALLLPTAKRLQDIGHPATWALYTLIPTALYLGIIQLIPSFPRFSKYAFLCTAALEAAIMLYLLIRKGTDAQTENGGNPLTEQPAISSQNSGWIMTTLTAFLSVGIVFMILQNPKTDIQSLFIGRVQYIQSHAIYVLWLGYGILFLMAYLETLVKNNRYTKIIGVVMVLLLPFSLIYKNYHNENQLKVVGGAEQNGHDFGWQFGNWQLRGVDGIKDDLSYWYPDEEEFLEQWEAYPCKDYPEPMGPNAIFFGGTDPGRFVPTYMIYSAKVRPDVYLITQNALADNTYMNVMRDLYGDQIWIPSPLDSNLAFQQYVQGVQNGSINAGADVTTEGGKVQVQGVAGVMKINGFLSKMIFDHNQYITETKTDEKTRPVGAAAVFEDPVKDPKTGLPPLRTFYVEESYVLPWMYPYLTPHGLIMKINNKPTALTPEMVKNDTDFWNWYCDRLLNDEKFIRDIVARKSFSKLRSALAGLYAARGKPREAEAAFRQSVALYDLSPEANFRLADLIAKQGRFDEAIEIFDVFMEKDPNNEKGEAFRLSLKFQFAQHIFNTGRHDEAIGYAEDLLDEDPDNEQIIKFQENLEKMKKMTARRVELETKLKAGGSNFQEMLELMNIQYSLGQSQQADALARNILNSDNIPPEGMMSLAQYMAQKRKLDIVELALKKYTSTKPNDTQGWINLAGLQLVTNKRGEMWVSLRKAVEIGGEPVRNHLRSDKRFDTIRNTKEFQKIVPKKTTPSSLGLSPLPGM